MSPSRNQQGRKSAYSSALPAWCMGRRSSADSNQKTSSSIISSSASSSHHHHHQFRDDDEDPEAKHSKPHRSNTNTNINTNSQPQSPKNSSQTTMNQQDPLQKLNRDPEHVRGTRKARMFLMCLPIVLIFLMILRPFYAPFIDVFGGDLLDQLLASEEGQGHVSAVSVSDDFLNQHWPIEGSGENTASSQKRKKKSMDNSNSDHHNHNRKMLLLLASSSSSSSSS